MKRVLVTGATGLLGAEVVDRMLRQTPDIRIQVLVRDAARWRLLASRRGLPMGRVSALVGNVRMPGLGLDAGHRSGVTKDLDAVIHLAGDIVFSRPLAEARATNVEGARHTLDLLDGRKARFCQVSTAFVAGCRTGGVYERDDGGQAGWVNAYEQSKWEAEQLVRTCEDFLIFRPSTVVCDNSAGEVTQVNAVHRSLRLFHAGLAPMIPGTETSRVDLVTAEYVADAIARLALRPELSGETLHLCAGDASTTLGELLDLSFDFWTRDPAWRRRGIARPILTDLETYRVFESAVEETGDARLTRVTRSLTHFAPQLALAKRFDTSVSQKALGQGAPRTAAYWTRVLDYLRRNHWSPETARIAA